MNRSKTALTVALFLAIGAMGAPAHGEDAFGALRMVPSDLPIVAVVADFEKLDQSSKAFTKPFGDDVRLGVKLGDLKEELEIGSWIDFGKPFIFALAEPGDDDQNIYWANVPGFAGKIKSKPGATEVDGIWELPIGEGPEAKKIYLKVRGDYVVVCPKKDLLKKVSKPETHLAKELKSRGAVFGNREVLIHVNMDPLRDAALAKLDGVAQMAPMMLMMATAQGGGGGDPATTMAISNGLFDAVRRLVEQVAYVDVAITVSAKSIDATIAGGFRDGPVRAYLAQQKPASAALLTEIEDQPYFLASGYHIPSESSPICDYILEKVIDALYAQPTVANEQERGATARGIKTVLDMYRKIEGGNTVIAMSSDGIKKSGNYIGKDTAEIVKLAKQAFLADNPLSNSFASGIKIESLGTKRIGKADVDLFSLKLDPTNPAMGRAGAMVGKNAQFGIGVVKDRVRYCHGTESDLQQVFSGRVGSSLASSSFVKEALAGLPRKRNAVVLLDLAAAVGSFGAMMGAPSSAGPAPPGPPVAMSVSLAGEPARLDIHVPARALERAKQAWAPDQPPPPPQ